MKVEKFKINEISSSLYRQLCSLSFRENGELMSALIDTRRNGDLRSDIYIVAEDDIILGWGLVFTCGYYRKRREYQCYVRVKYRNNGIGKMLLKCALQAEKKLYVKPHDNNNSFARQLYKKKNRGYLNYE